MNSSKNARNAASITNRATCGGPKKAGLMGYIGGVGTGGMNPRQGRTTCGSSTGQHICGRYMNTVMFNKCVGNYSNAGQSTARMARRGMF